MCEQPESAEKIFVKFHYAEVKDLSKQFLTLIAGTLVLTVSFADKIVPIDHATVLQRTLLCFCWLFLLLAFALAGLGIYVNYLAAEQASGGLIYDYKSDFKSLARKSYVYLDAAAGAFTLSLCLLGGAGASRLF